MAKYAHRLNASDHLPLLHFEKALLIDAEIESHNVSYNCFEMNHFLLECGGNLRNLRPNLGFAALSMFRATYVVNLFLCLSSFAMGISMSVPATIIHRKQLHPNGASTIVLGLPVPNCLQPRTCKCCHTLDVVRDTYATL